MLPRNWLGQSPCAGKCSLINLNKWSVVANTHSLPPLYTLAHIHTQDKCSSVIVMSLLLSEGAGHSWWSNCAKHHRARLKYKPQFSVWEGKSCLGNTTNCPGSIFRLEEVSFHTCTHTHANTHTQTHTHHRSFTRDRIRNCSMFTH